MITLTSLPLFVTVLFRGMHWHTYARLHDRKQQAVGEMYAGLAAWLDTLKRRTLWC